MMILSVDLPPIPRRMRDFQKFLDFMKQCPARAILAGGALRWVFGDDTLICDYDIFFHDEAAAEATKTFLGANTSVAIVHGPNVVTFRISEGATTFDVQAVDRKFFKNGHELVNDFDLTATRSFMYVGGGETSKVHFCIDTFMDVIERRIKFAALQNPANILNRIVKYTKKGYIIEPSEMKRVTKYIFDVGAGRVQPADNGWWTNYDT